MSGNRSGFLLYWGIPIAVLVVGGIYRVEAYLWPPALLFMGATCLLNALRCGRLHCYFTGPFFLAAATVAGLPITGLVTYSPEIWNWIGLTVVIGGILLTHLPERIWGKYARNKLL